VGELNKHSLRRVTSSLFPPSLPLSLPLSLQVHSIDARTDVALLHAETKGEAARGSDWAELKFAAGGVGGGVGKSSRICEYCYGWDS